MSLIFLPPPLPIILIPKPHVCMYFLFAGLFPIAKQREKAITLSPPPPSRSGCLVGMHTSLVAASSLLLRVLHFLEKLSDLVLKR